MKRIPCFADFRMIGFQGKRKQLATRVKKCQNFDMLSYSTHLKHRHCKVCEIIRKDLWNRTFLELRFV